MFFHLYSEYSRQAPIDDDSNAQEFKLDSANFDFYMHLYAIGRKPGLYLGSGASVQLIAAYLAGYFKGKSDAKVKLSRDEKEFFRFEEWMRLHNKFKRRYPWYRLIEMWPYVNLNSFECFFAYYDSFLTDFGKNPRGLDDLFEVISDKSSTTFRRRKKLPKKLIQSPETKRPWRGYCVGWKAQ
jgi:hypothetical protein